MHKIYTCLFFLYCAASLFAQAPYTQKQFGWRIESDLEYGQAVNYAGIPVSLTLDLYKPLGDNNPQRPLMVLVHGGSWLTGCKEHVAWLAVELAQRGYAVASVNYRKGWHKAASVDNPPPTPDQYPSNCLYAADSMELIRAIYRGQQDVKAAIRWLKARHVSDSTCTQKVLVGGESAGAFLSLAVALLDRPEEKPTACLALPDAPVPAANVSNCYDQDCAFQLIHPTGTALQRPDLGPLDGVLNQNGYDSHVIGVASFFGGVPYEALPNQWLKGPDTPALYLYHQTCDGVVPFGYGQPMTILSAYCNLGYSPWHTRIMHTFGNGSIAAALQSLPDPPPFTMDFLPCPEFNPDLALFECLRYGDNGSYHFSHNQPERAQKVADFFSPVIGNGACFSVASKDAENVPEAVLTPNPFGEQLSILWSSELETEAYLLLSDISGKTVWADRKILTPGSQVLFDQKVLPAGFYVLQIRTKKGTGVWKLVRE